MWRMLAVFFIASAAMLLVFNFADWRAENSALPRYCEDPRDAIERVREILVGDMQGADQSKRPYLIAAKLIFLVPQEASEPTPAYLERLRVRISQTCGSYN